MATTDLLIETIKEAINPFIAEVIRNEFKRLSAEQLAEKFLSVDTGRKMFDPEISRGTLYNWEDKGLINSYIIGGKRLYKYSELLEAVTRIKKYSRNNSTEVS